MPRKKKRAEAEADAGVRPLTRGQVEAAGVVGALTLGVVALACWTWPTTWAQQNEERRQRILALVGALPAAPPGAVPGILDDLAEHRSEVLPRLRERYQQENVGGRKVRLALALLPVQPEAVRDLIVKRMLSADDPAEVVLLRDQLRPHAAELAPRLWETAEDAGASDAARFRALVALAALDCENDCWEAAAPELVDQLLAENLVHLGTWVQALVPIRAALDEPLGRVARDTRPERAWQQAVAAQMQTYLAEAPALQRIEALGGRFYRDLKQPTKPVTVVDLSRTEVTDADLKQLQGLRQLATLSLNSTQVTDAGLNELKELGRLTALYLGQTKVTDAGMMALKELRPLTELYLGGAAVTDAGSD